MQGRKAVLPLLFRPVRHLFEIPGTLSPAADPQAVFIGEQRIIRRAPFHLKAPRVEMTDPRLFIGITARDENMVSHHQRRRGFPPPS